MSAGQLAEAVEHLAAVMAEAAGFDPATVSGLTCNELEAIAEVLNAGGYPAEAEKLRLAHAVHDEPGEMHYGLTP